MGGLAGSLLGEVLALLGELQLGADDVEEVCRIGLVVDGEAGVDADGRAVNAEQAGSRRVERAAPDLVGRRQVVVALLRFLRRWTAADGLDALEHGLGGPAGER